VTYLPVTHEPELRPQRRSRPTHRQLAPLYFGVLGLVISVAASWNPSYWGDEAASVMSAERSLPSLFRMLGTIDAVHGAYYLMLHFWIDLFGASEFSTRLPSAIAIGVATAGTFTLARMLTGARVAWIAAIVFAVLPRVTYMGAEARSTAVAAAIAVWLVVLLVHLLRAGTASRPVRTWLWIGFTALFALGIYVFLYIALLVPVLGIAVFLLAPDRARRRGQLIAWAAATVVGLAIAAPVLLAGVSQKDQLSFIGRRAQTSVLDAAVNQWFGNVPAALIAWALILLAVGLAWFGRGRVPILEGTRAAFGVMLTWMLIPSAALLIGTHVVTPMYSLRYLSICTPAAAIALGIALAWIRPRWAGITALVLLVAAVVPSYIDQRGPYAKNSGSDWRQAAAIVEAGAHPGDAIVFDESVRPSRKPRLALHLYLQSFTRLHDVTLDTAYGDTGSLWDTTLPLTSVLDSLAGTDTVWLVQYSGSSEEKAGTDLRTLRDLGFSVASTATVIHTTITELTR
jgi:mannosyltransferase